MIHRALGRAVPIELTTDVRIRDRVARLTLVSLLALGILAGLAAVTTEAPPAVVAVLVTGWLAMPAVLAWSLRRPSARYALVLPASLVSLGLLAICVGWLPASTAASAGWLLLASGVWLGAALGLWLWFRLVPAPAALHDPFAPGRWALIGLHVGLVALGAALAATALPG